MRSKNDWLDYLEHLLHTEEVICHYGVLGMHWGIRRYQPYSQAPRKSGKSGKEVGTAKEVFNSLSRKEKRNVSTNGKYSESPLVVKQSVIKGKDGHAKAYAEIEKDPWNPTEGYLTVAVNKNDRGKGLSEKVCKEVIEGAKESGLKEIYWETTKDNLVSSAVAKKLGFEPAKNFNKNDDNYVLKLDEPPKKVAQQYYR